ncbi:hypothetical protein Gotur_022894 [Gossypium turneri]
MQQEKGDSLTEGYVSELWDFTCISVTQNNLQELKQIWGQWDDDIKQLFYCHYGDLPYLLDIKKVDLVPTVEEYTTLLRCPKVQADKAYSRAANIPTFLKKLMSITEMSEQWVKARIKQKGDYKCIHWRNLRDLILAHLDMKKRVDIFALSIYGLVAFPKALGYIDEAVFDLFNWLDRGVVPVPVPLLGIWGVVGYAALLVLRQYRSRQFIPATQGLAQCEFSYKGDNYKKKVREISNTWNQTRKMKIFVVNPMMTPEYSWWWGKRIYDNIPVSSQANIRLIEEHLQVIPSELDIIKTAGLGKTSEQWQQEIKEEKIRADQWEKKFQDTRAREFALERSLLE